jgi:tungstate transport system permease protein
VNFIADGLVEAMRLIFALDPEVYSISWLSLRVAIIATAVASVAGIPAGCALAMARFRGRDALLTVSNTMMSFPSVLVGLVCYALISSRGPLGALEMLFTPWGIIFGDVVLAFPLIVSLTAAVAESVDRRASETAVSLGASPFRLMRTIISEARPAVVAVVIAAFGRVISEVGAAMMLGGNISGITRTLTTAIALETGKGEFAFAVALGIILLVIALAANIVMFRLRAAGRRA